MSDIYLKPEAQADMVIINGLPQLTDGLDNAVYLSLFMPDYWGNDITDDKYISEIPKIMTEQLLSNQTRLDIIDEAKNALNWMIEKGIASAIEITAEIPDVGKLYLAVKIFEPEFEDPFDFAYALNWDAQEIIVQEGTW